jgi:hypothetical protein
MCPLSLFSCSGIIRFFAYPDTDRSIGQRQPVHPTHHEIKLDSLIAIVPAASPFFKYYMQLALQVVANVRNGAPAAVEPGGDGRLLLQAPRPATRQRH